MSTESASSNPKEKALDQQTLQDILSLLAKIGPREALAFNVTVSGENYVLQLMPRGTDACVVTAFKKASTGLSFQFAINITDGRYLYGDDIAENTVLLQNLLAEAKAQPEPVSPEVPPVSKGVLDRIKNAVPWLPAFLMDLATLPEHGRERPLRNPDARRDFDF